MMLNRFLAIGLSSLALLAAPAGAGPLAGVLDGNGAMRTQTWQTAYLMAEGSAEARVIGPLNRGARLEIDPSRSNEQYWFVHVPDSPGGAWQGYVWKDFVRVNGGGADAAAAAPSTGASPRSEREPASAASGGRMAPMTETLARRERRHKRGKAHEEAPADEAVPGDLAEAQRPRVEMDRAEAAPAKDSSLVAYDPELFEVTDASTVRPNEPSLPAREPGAPQPTQILPPATSQNINLGAPIITQSAPPPPPAGSNAGAAAAPVTPAARAEHDGWAAPVQPRTTGPAVGPAASAAAEPAPARISETDVASPVRQIQALREQIERELEAAPQTALTPGAAQNVDALIGRLNEVLKVERSMVTFLESTAKMVEAHDQHIHELETRVTGMAAKGGPERAALSEEIARLRHRLDELSATVSTTRQHAKRIDALEAQIKHGGTPVTLEPASSKIEPDHGSIAVGASDAELDRKAGEVEKKIKKASHRAKALARAVDGDVDIPAIDSRSAEREQKARKPKATERVLEEGVIEVVANPQHEANASKDDEEKPAKAPTPAASPESPTAPEAPPQAKPQGPPRLPPRFEKGSGLLDTGVSSMLRKLRDLREERRKARLAKEAAGTSEPRAAASPAPTPGITGASLEEKAAAEPPESASEAGRADEGPEPVPDDLRDDAPAKNPAKKRNVIHM